MKRCSHCYQMFSDEVSFCLSDGTPLIQVFDQPEEATVIKSSPHVRQPAPPVRQGVSPVFAYLAIALLALIVGGAFVLWLKSDSKSAPSPKNDVATASVNSTESEPSKQQSEPSGQKFELEKEQLRLEKEKQQLASERKKLESKKNNSAKSTTFNQTSSSSQQPTARIKFGRGSLEETISGSIGIERSFVLYTLQGQTLSANVNSSNGCVSFKDGSTSANYTTNRGDTYLRLKNNCGANASFNLTVYIR